MRRPRSHILTDLVFLVLFVATTGSALATAISIDAATTARLAGPMRLVLLPALVPVFLLVLCVEVFALRLLAGRLAPGNHPFPGGRMARIWVIHFALWRILHNPLWRQLLYGVSGLRFAMLRALGARAAFAFEASSDATILDPAMQRISAGCVIGAGVSIYGHTIQDGRLHLASSHIGPGVQLLLGAMIGPGTTLGDGVLVGPYTHLAGRSEFGAGTRIGHSCSLSAGLRIGRDVRIGDDVVIEAAVKIGDGARVQSHAVVRRGTTIAAGAVHPPRRVPEAG